MKPSAKGRGEIWPRLVWALAFALVLYLVPYIIVMADEVWFETKIIAKHTPAWTSNVFQTVYAPLFSDAFKTTTTYEISK